MVFAFVAKSLFVLPQRQTRCAGFRITLKREGAGRLERELQKGKALAEKRTGFGKNTGASWPNQALLKTMGERLEKTTSQIAGKTS
jgi:hypothetical protein